MGCRQRVLALCNLSRADAGADPQDLCERQLPARHCGHQKRAATECNTGGPAWNFMIYGQILNPIAAGCGGGGSLPGSISVYRNSTAVPSSAINSRKTSESVENSNMNATFIIVAGGLVIVVIIAFIAYRAGKRRGKNNSLVSHRSLSPSAYASVESSYKNRNVVIDRHARRARYVPASSPYIPLPYIPASPVVGACSSPDALSSAPTGPSSNSTAATGIFSQVAFGEVLDGYYKGEAVAIKRLLPSLRDNMNEIESFVDEAKMLMTLRHTRVVQFIGVAWDAPTDLCIVTELMEGGDLQSMLRRADANYESTGFHADKVKIALHMIHALSYLHSLTPPVVHRDLKSTNVLLTKNFDAKLTDFGTSRERGDSIMTSNVGSWLWMAPEVMLGKQYDERADIFSFGVVLSELDTQKAPYSHAREPDMGRKLPEMVMLNMVSAGRLTVAFSGKADADMVAIGHECVALDPKRRPTASEVLRRIDKIYRRHLHVVL